jgi:predicted dehydrogenase
LTKVGVIGLGKMGILHSGILNSLPNVTLQAICESESFVLRAAKSILPKNTACYKNHHDMLKNENLDAVFVTTPINSHSSLILDIARADRNLSIFVEKPLATSLSQAQEACDVVRDLAGIHMVGFQKRFSPIFKKAKEILVDKALGDLIFFRGYSFSSDVLREAKGWRLSGNSGGVLLDLAPHLVDVTLWLFGEPTDVMSSLSRVYSAEVEDYVHANFQYASGLKGNFDACWSIRNFRMPEIRIEVYGKNGTLVVTDDFVTLSTDRHIGQTQTLHKQSFNTSVPFLLADPEYTWEDLEFIAKTRERTLPDLNFFEAAKVNSAIDRIVAANVAQRRSEAVRSV